MKQPPSTRLVFSVVLLVLGGVAIAGGALQTLGETLGHSVQADRLPPFVSSQPPREQPASLAPGVTVAAGPQPAPIPARSNRLFDADHLLAARQALEELPALAGHRLTVFHSIHFYDDGRINLDLVDPQHPSRVDSYHFERGQWRRGDPVDPQRFAPTITLRRSSTALANIDFEAVPRVAQALQAQRNALMGTPGEVGHVYVIVRKGGTLVWLPDEVAGDRQSARLSFDAQGALRGTSHR
ncbi:hypothetical protein [Stenotrophomonas maltophilia]|uniref:hypothetical protein n=1 Tax=Stenotrophomonas maltophilia TaxID=40324 RepID=UPI00021E0661|nr:hypothetical protein [Stenotrophomonas maltophilia]AEM50447.1 hypothetical protein BurJV3_1115 [Stenotrophomonas maltophilia JV3]